MRRLIEKHGEGHESYLARKKLEGHNANARVAVASGNFTVSPDTDSIDKTMVMSAAQITS